MKVYVKGKFSWNTALTHGLVDEIFDAPKPDIHSLTAVSAEPKPTYKVPRPAPDERLVMDECLALPRLLVRDRQDTLHETCAALFYKLEELSKEISPKKGVLGLRNGLTLRVVRRKS